MANKPVMPIKPVKKTDELDVYMQKNINLKNKIKILEKDVDLWKQNFSDFQQELSTQRGDQKKPKTQADRDYFLRMLDDYKEAYEERINALTE